MPSSSAGREVSVRRSPCASRRLFSDFGALRFMNMAIYEIVDGKIAAWHDYTNSAHARKLLGL
jgi:limonene-1,2-epoxide hydrolase